MKLYIKTLAALAFAATALGAAAQSTQTGYFLSDYTYRYQMNPAFDNSRGFFAFPVLGNIDAGLRGSLHPDALIYNLDGKTTTFLNPGISTSEVLGNLSDLNQLNIDARLTLLALGFKAFNGYNTLTVSTKVNAGVTIPSDIFRFMKEGISNSTYHLGDINAYGRAWVDVALSHSHEIIPGLRVGATIKGIVGAGNVDARLRRADLALGTDNWTVTTDAEITANLKGLSYETDVNDRTGHRYVSGVKFDSDQVGVAGYGFGADLGVVWTPNLLPILDDFTFSFSLTDLGTIKWDNNMLATTGGIKQFQTDKYTFNVDDNAANSFDNTLDAMKDALSALYELEDRGDAGSTTTALGTTMNIGVEYTFPLYRKLTFGLLNTTRFQGPYGWSDFRLSANIAPCSFFDCAVSAGTGTFGPSWGFLMNLHCPGFNLFLGSDCVPSKLAKDGIPMRSLAQVNLGLNFLF